VGKEKGEIGVGEGNLVNATNSFSGTGFDTRCVGKQESKQIREKNLKAVMTQVQKEKEKRNKEK